MKKLLILLTFTLLLNIVSYSQYSCKELVKLLLITEISDSTELLKVININLHQEFIKAGKDAIPYLIDVIDLKKYGLFGCIDGYSSNYNQYVNFIGIRAINEIDIIFGDTTRCRKLYKPVVRLEII